MNTWFLSCLMSVVSTIIIALSAFGQGSFVKTLGGSNWDIGYVVEVSDSRLVIIGETESYGAGDNDFLLAQLSRF